MLLTLLLPAVQSAREGARRMQCSSHLRQLALATLSYESTRGTLPPGSYGHDPRTHEYPAVAIARTPFCAFILPYLEQPAFRDGYDFSKDYFNQPSAPVGMYLTVWNCPSDSRRLFAPGYAAIEHKGNYGLNWGPTTFAQVGAAGVFDVAYPRPLAEIRDGASNTLMFLEMLQAPVIGDVEPDRRGRLWNDDSGSYQITTLYTPNHPAPDNTVCVDRPELGLPCINSGNSFRRDHYITSRSRHPGGVMSAWCDGSVRYVASDVSSLVWQAASTSAAGELLGSF
jgi:prepilin-type processing-associated H-X9-DG protein